MRSTVSIAVKAILLLLLATSVAHAADDGVWAAGMKAFGNGKYSVALANFEAARTAGQSGPAVHYNIAVCQFQLGDYNAADDNFTLIAERFPDMRPLAEYNRGLVAVEQHRRSDARRHFLAAYQLSPTDETLRILASTMLRRTEEWQSAVPAMSGALGLHTGYDDNIVLRDDTGLPLGTSTDSLLAEMYGALLVPISALPGLTVDANAYLLGYFDNDDFDQTSIRAGLGYQWQGSSWQLRAGINAGFSTLGGDSFDSTTTAYARWLFGPSPAATVRFDYQYTDVSAGDTLFDGIEGSRQRLAVRYRWQRDSHRFDLAYRFEDNDRIDPSVSASRDRVRIRYRYQMNSSWSYDFGAEFRRSDYGDLVPKRSEDRTTLSAGITRTLNADWLLLAEIQVVDNDATDALFSYTRNQLKIGVMRYFQGTD